MFGWFKRNQKKPEQAVWQDDVPPGEAEKVILIKKICEMGAYFGRIISNPLESAESLDRNRPAYEEKKKLAVETARELTDPFFRDAALHSLVSLCMAAKEEGEARRFFDAIEDSMIRERVLDEF